MFSTEAGRKEFGLKCTLAEKKHTKAYQHTIENPPNSTRNLYSYGRIREYPESRIRR